MHFNNIFYQSMLFAVAESSLVPVVFATLAVFFVMAVVGLAVKIVPLFSGTYNKGFIKSYYM